MKGKIFLFQLGLGHGGATRSNLRIASGLADRGLNITLVYGHGSIENETLIPHNLQTIKLDSSKNLSILIKLAKLLQIQKPSLVIAGAIQPNIVVFLAKLLSMNETKVMFIDRVAPSIEITHKRKFIYKILPLLMRIFYYKVDKVIAVSHECAEDIKKIVGEIGERLTVIYNPAITEEKLSKSYLPVSHPYFLLEVPVLVSVGRLVKQKDFATLIKAFALVLQKMNCTLLILGEGEERESLESLIHDLNIQNNVELLGHIDNPHPYLRNADLFVLSSAWEGLPNVLLEAMAYGTSVVSTNCVSGPKEILYDGALAPMVDVGDYSAMADAILDTLKTPQDPEKLIARANDFNETKSLTMYENLIKDLINS